MSIADIQSANASAMIEKEIKIHHCGLKTTTFEHPLNRLGKSMENATG